MNRLVKGSITFALAVVFVVVIRTGFRSEKLGDDYCSTKAAFITNEILDRDLAKSWKTLRANGETSSVWWRENSRFYLLKEGDVEAFERLKSNLERRGQNFRENVENSFKYFPEGSGFPRRGHEGDLEQKDETDKRMRWWNFSGEPDGIGVLIQTNLSKKVLTLNIYAFKHATNALMYVRIDVSDNG